VQQPNDGRAHLFSEDGNADFGHFSAKRIRVRDELNDALVVLIISPADADIGSELGLREI
jgi:hypothetical protein